MIVGQCDLSELMREVSITAHCTGGSVNPRPEGGGVLSLKKGTDCGPIAGELWLSRPATAKKGALSLYHIVG